MTKQTRMLFELFDLDASFEDFRLRSNFAVLRAKWGLVLCTLLSAGCGQVVIRQEPCTLGTLSEFDATYRESSDADCGAFPKSRLGWHDRLKGGVGHCSDKLSECWYSSCVGQWHAKKRDEKNAPPYPKFHPIPTHPALFPEPELEAPAAEIPIVEHYGQFGPSDD